MSLDIRIAHDFAGFALDVDIAAPPGVTVLFGRSGSGKSTIVKAVAGLLRPKRGRIAVGGRVVLDTEARVHLPPHRRRFGTIFQDGRLFPHLSVRQNLAYGRWFAPRRVRTGETARVVEMLGIGALLDRRPGALSGGEKQRVAIGRALLASPDLILADEPLAALDEERKAEILPYFERLRDEVSVPILYVSHSAAEVARLATTVVALKDGRVARAGPTAQVLADPMVTPTGIRAAGAILDARVLRHHADGISELDAGGIVFYLPRVEQAPGQRLRIRIPAQEVILARDPPKGLSALNVLPGRVASIRSGAGPGAMVSLDTRAGPILARITARSVAALGLVPGADCHAIVKSVAIAPEDVGGAAIAQGTGDLASTEP